MTEANGKRSCIYERGSRKACKDSQKPIDSAVLCLFSSYRSTASCISLSADRPNRPSSPASVWIAMINSKSRERRHCRAVSLIVEFIQGMYSGSTLFKSFFHSRSEERTVRCRNVTISAARLCDDYPKWPDREEKAERRYRDPQVSVSSEREGGHDAFARSQRSPRAPEAAFDKNAVVLETGGIDFKNGA